jgi:hypothetical protein
MRPSWPLPSTPNVAPGRITPAFIERTERRSAEHPTATPV